MSSLLTIEISDDLTAVYLKIEGKTVPQLKINLAIPYDSKYFKQNDARLKALSYASTQINAIFARERENHARS